MFPLLLNGWKSKAKNEHLAKDCDEIQKMWPSVSEVEWNLFKEHGKTLEVKVMENEVEYASTKGNTIGSRGYLGKRLKCIKQDVEYLKRELESMYAALRKVGEVPRDQLDEQVKLWANQVRDLSFRMEDVVDKFLVRVDDGSKPAPNSKKLKQLTKMMAGLFTKWKAHHEIIDAIEEINKQLQEVANMHGRYPVDNIVSSPAAVAPIDPRLRALYTEVTELVGIAGKRDQELMKLLSEGDNVSKKKLKIVTVVGFGGLGKTTLVKTVYDKIKGEFDCRAFVSVGRNASAKKVLMDILLALDMYESHFTILGETQLIDKLRERLQNKRYDLSLTL